MTDGNAAPRDPDRRADILRAARGVFMDLGYRRFTMRRVAAAAGISLGNLNYHFPRKDALVKAMLESVIDRYVAEFERRRSRAGAAPEKQLAAVLDYWIEDLRTPETTLFFPELWALANHDPHVAEMTDGLYVRARAPIIDLIPSINPTLDRATVEQRALLMCAAMEGLTIFAGHDKPWRSDLAPLKRQLIRALMELLKAPAGDAVE